MSSQDTGKTPIEAFRESLRPAFGGYVGAAKSWAGRHPNIARALWLALGLILLVLLVWAIRPGATTSTRGMRGLGGPQPVGVAKAASGDIHVTLNALGTVTPLATVTVRPQVSGTLLKINFTEGQNVKAGDVLAEIDPRTFQAAVDQAKGQLARDSANLQNAIVDLGRQKGLMAANATSQQAYDTQAATVRSDQGIVKSDQANVESAQINLGYTKIVAPVSGRVGLHLVDIGNIVQAGQTGGIVVVTQLNPISVLFSVPEDNISDIMAQVSAGASLSVGAYDRSQTVKIASGTLATVDNVIDTTTGTVKLRALFDNADDALFPNQFVNVKLLVNTLHDQTVAPAAAIQRGSDGTFVFVVTPDKTVAMRTVTVGVQDGDKIDIVKGLSPGDTVVVDGADRLRDGAEVTIPNNSQSISAPSAEVGSAASQTQARAARMAKLAATMKKYCGEDLAKYCPGTTPGRAQMMCIFQNRASFSETCQAEMKKMRHNRGSGGGGGGFGGTP